jgi:sporulation protein YlmC with PRC-barrel domain
VPDNGVRRAPVRTAQRFAKSKEEFVKKLLLVAALAVLANGSVLAAEPSTMTPSAGDHAFMTAVPSDGYTVKDWYKQNVYDPSQKKIGEIEDVIIDKSGKVTAVIISVGGFLGIDSKDVAAPFSAVHPTMKDNKWWLTMDTTKDALKSAPGYRYDSNTTRWVADRS